MRMEVVSITTIMMATIVMMMTMFETTMAKMVMMIVLTNVDEDGVGDDVFSNGTAALRHDIIMMTMTMVIPHKT